jgi:Transglycosylase SLT domain
MRHLFVPACCLGLLTGGGVVGPEVSMAKLPDPIVQRAAPADIGADIDIDIDAAKPAPDQSAQMQAEGAAVVASTGYADRYEIPDPIAESVPARPRPLKPIVKPIIPRSRAEICDTVTDAAQRNNLPAPFFIRLLFQESGFRPGVVSSAGAEGVAQFMPETAASRGLDNPFDPVQAITAAAGLLRDLAHRFGNLGLAAAAYNAGPKRIHDWLAQKGKLPQETQDYVKTITGRRPEGWTIAEAGSPAIKLQRHAPCQEAAGLLAWDGPDRIPLPPMRADARKAPPPPTAHDDAKTAKLAHDKSGKHATATADAAANKAPVKDNAPAKEAVAEKAAAKHVHHAATQLAADKAKRPRVHLTER